MGSLAGCRFATSCSVGALADSFAALPDLFCNQDLQLEPFADWCSWAGLDSELGSLAVSKVAALLAVLEACSATLAKRVAVLQSRCVGALADLQFCNLAMWQPCLGNELETCCGQCSVETWADWQKLQICISCNVGKLTLDLGVATLAKWAAAQSLKA